MQVVNSLPKQGRCHGCKNIMRNGVRIRICSVEAKHKARQGKPSKRQFNR